MSAIWRLPDQLQYTNLTHTILSIHAYACATKVQLQEPCLKQCTAGLAGGCLPWLAGNVGKISLHMLGDDCHKFKP